MSNFRGAVQHSDGLLLKEKRWIKKQAESYIVYSAFAAIILLFALLPAHPSSNFDFALERFADEYLFGNGYYKPVNYPFASKITNSFSVVLMAASGLFVGIWRKDDVTVNEAMKRIFPWFALLAPTLLMLWISVMPKEFADAATRYSFGRTEAFHNNLITYMLFMLMKSGIIYIGIRVPASGISYLLANKKKRAG